MFGILMKRISIVSVTRARTAEERLRRHLHGDKGATFSKGKYMILRDNIMGCVTTMATKDNICAEIYESN